MIGLLVLKAVDERLAEKAELVVDAVAEAGVVHRGQRIEEAGGQPSQSAIAEGRVGLQRLELVQIDAHLGGDRFGVIVEAEVH